MLPNEVTSSAPGIFCANRGMRLSKINSDHGTAASQTAFNALRWIVTIGWAIYPIGYVLGIGDSGSAADLNLVYNLADFVNKIAFGVVIWAAATSESAASGKG